jgi:hypothetical protein
MRDQQRSIVIVSLFFGCTFFLISSSISLSLYASATEPLIQIVRNLV